MMRNQAAIYPWFAWRPMNDCVITLVSHICPNRSSLLSSMSAVHDVQSQVEASSFRLQGTFHYQHSRISGKSRSLSGIHLCCRQEVLHLPDIMPATQQYLQNDLALRYLLRRAEQR